MSKKFYNILGDKYMWRKHIIGIVVAAVILVVLVIKYISSTQNNYAENKKQLIIYVIGVVLIFAPLVVIWTHKFFSMH